MSDPIYLLALLPAVLLAALFVQSFLLRQAHERQIRLLKEEIRALQQRCDEANARADRMEAEFGKTLAQLSLLMGRVG